MFVIIFIKLELLVSGMAHRFELVTFLLYRLEKLVKKVSSLEESLKTEKKRSLELEGMIVVYRTEMEKLKEEMRDSKVKLNRVKKLSVILNKMV